MNTVVSQGILTLWFYSISACGGQTVVKTYIKAINSVRSDLDFDLIWKYICNNQYLLNKTSSIDTQIVYS